MNRKLLSVGLGLAMLAGVQTAGAQGYRMEIGAMAGGSFYMGDANQTLFRQTRPAFDALCRYNLNKRFTLKADLGVAGIAGTTVGNTDEYPGGTELDFARTLADGSLQLEFNFYEFGAPDYTPGASRLSPYLTVGLGGLVWEDDGLKGTALVPFGLGIKYKLPNRFNIGLEWTGNLSFSDRLDAPELDDPWIAPSSWNKNKDGFSALRLYVSYDIWFIGSNCYKE